MEKDRTWNSPVLEGSYSYFQYSCCVKRMSCGILIHIGRLLVLSGQLNLNTGLFFAQSGKSRAGIVAGLWPGNLRVDNGTDSCYTPKVRIRIKKGGVLWTQLGKKSAG